MSCCKEELPLQMTENSYQNIMIFFIFKHTQSFKKGLGLPECQSRCHCKLCSLMTPDWETLLGKSTKENPSSCWQVGLFTNYLFPSIRHTREFTCICSTMLCCSLLSHPSSLWLIHIIFLHYISKERQECCAFLIMCKNASWHTAHRKLSPGRNWDWLFFFFY